MLSALSMSTKPAFYSNKQDYLAHSLGQTLRKSAHSLISTYILGYSSHEVSSEPNVSWL